MASLDCFIWAILVMYALILLAVAAYFAIPYPISVNVVLFLAGLATVDFVAGIITSATYGTIAARYRRRFDIRPPRKRLYP